MGFLSGGLTFQRLRVAGPKPRLFDDAHLDRLRGLAAGREKVASADGVEVGWSAGGHIFDTDFTLEKNVYPDHLLFDLRVQTDRFPADRLKAYYATELKALSKDNPSGFPSARQKREAREIARDRLEQEAKDGRYKKWKCHPVLWDGSTRTAFFGTASLADLGRFESMWEATFCKSLYQDELAGGLSPLTASSLAVALHPQAENEALSPFVPGVTPEDRPSWCAAEGVPDFLGNEFLLWLWYFSDAEGDTVKTPDGSDVTFMFSGGVKVDDPRGQTGNCTANSDSAVRLPEAKAAVRAGKLPRKAALTVVRNADQFSFVLQAETLALSAVKLPKADPDLTTREREMERLQFVRDLAEIVDQLYAAFLARRISAYWSGDVKQIAAWLKAGGRVKA